MSCMVSDGVTADHSPREIHHHEVVEKPFQGSSVSSLSETLFSLKRNVNPICTKVDKLSPYLFQCLVTLITF